VINQPLRGRFYDWMKALTEGKVPLPNSNAERHHYVAQFQLARFKGKGRLYQLDKETGEITPTTPKDAAWGTNLYKVESVSGEHDGVIEGYFAIAENFAAPALRRFLANPASLTEDDRCDLAFLIAIQEQRVPGFQAEMKENMTHAAIGYLAVELANTKGPKGKRREARETYEALTEGSIRIEPPDQEVLLMSLEMFANTSMLICALPWTLLTATEGAFVCCDRPLTMYDPTPKFPWSAPGWMSSPMVEATMPLGKGACVRIGPSQRQRLGIQPTAKQVMRINLRSYGAATRYLYGPSKELLASLHETAQSDPAAVPKPIKKRMVLLEDPSTADPAIADRNAAKGWPRYIAHQAEDGTVRTMSYEVIDNEDDARRAVAPRTRTAGREVISELA
jgi:hypothetical protein